ncbi:MAG: hypothetical protein ABIL58_24255 [Pseudomonadota bacterium]
MPKSSNLALCDPEDGLTMEDAFGTVPDGARTLSTEDIFDQFEAPVIDLTKLLRFAFLENEKDRLTMELEKIKKERARMEPFLLEQFATATIDQMKIGGRTIYVHERVVAKKLGDDNAIIEAMKKDDSTKHLVKEGVNSKTLTAFVAELVKNDMPMPEALKSLLADDTVSTLKSIKS